MQPSLKRNITPGFRARAPRPALQVSNNPAKEPQDKKQVDDDYNRRPFGCGLQHIGPTKNGVEIDPGYTRTSCDRFAPSDDASQILGGTQDSITKRIFESLGF